MEKDFLNLKNEFLILLTETLNKVEKIKELKDKPIVLNDLSIKWERLKSKIDDIRLKIGEL